MRRVLLFIVLLPLIAALGLIGFHAYRDASFAAENPAPGKRLGPLHFIDQMGGEPAIVFLHGNPGTALDFAPVMQRLSPRHRVIAFDRPGYGWSDRPSPDLTPLDQAKLVHAALVELGINKPVLVGFSFGGPVAIAYALEYPTELQSLVLLAAVADPVEGHHMSGGQALLAEPLLGQAVAYSVGPMIAPGLVSEGYADAFSPAAPDATLVERGRLHFSRPKTLMASAHDWKVLEYELPKLAGRYEQLELPVEALAGNQDKVVGPSHAAFLEARVPGIHLVHLEQAGHQLMSTHTDEVVAAIERALGRVRP